MFPFSLSFTGQGGGSGQLSLPDPARMAALVDGTSHLLAAALSSKTTEQYRRSWLKFSTFCASMNFQALPAEVSTVAFFITSLADSVSPSSPASIASILSAISYIHNLNSLADPTQHFIVRKVLKGAANLCKGSDSRLPVTPAILLSLITALPDIVCCHYQSRPFASMISIMFHAFLRLGEVTTSPHNLLFENVTLNLASCAITFSSFKHSSGLPVTISIDKSISAPSCPIALLSDYLSLRGSGNGPLFCYPGFISVSPSKFRSVLSSALARSGRADLAITPHSFRIGAATHAAAQGVAPAVIQAMGRWKSHAYQRYIRISAIRL